MTIEIRLKEDLDPNDLMNRIRKKFSLKNLMIVSQNDDNNFYLIYSVKKVRNNINIKAKPRDEVLIVGIPKNKLYNTGD